MPRLSRHVSFAKRRHFEAVFHSRDDPLREGLKWCRPDVFTGVLPVKVTAWLPFSDCSAIGVAPILDSVYNLIDEISKSSAGTFGGYGKQGAASGMPQAGYGKQGAAGGIPQEGYGKQDAAGGAQRTECSIGSAPQFAWMVGG